MEKQVFPKLNKSWLAPIRRKYMKKPTFFSIEVCTGSKHEEQVKQHWEIRMYERLPPLEVRW